MTYFLKNRLYKFVNGKDMTSLEDFIRPMMPDLIASCKKLIASNWEPAGDDSWHPETLKGETVLKAVDDDSMNTDYIGVAFIPTLFSRSRIAIDLVVYMREGCKSTSFMHIRQRDEIIGHLESEEGFEEIVKKAEHLRKIAADY